MKMVRFNLVLGPSPSDGDHHQREPDMNLSITL